MEEKHLFKLLFIFFLLSHFLTLITSVPVSRSFTIRNQDPSGSFTVGNQDSSVMNMMKQKKTDEEMKMKEEDFLHGGRMEIESNDYPGSGANNRHDPRSPGRV